jgi:hypothetical protein
MSSAAPESRQPDGAAGVQGFLQGFHIDDQQSQEETKTKRYECQMAPNRDDCPNTARWHEAVRSRASATA